MVQVGGEAVRACRFSPDSTMLVSADDIGQVCLWDLVRRSLIRYILYENFTFHFKITFLSICFFVLFFRSFQKHDGAVQSVAFSPDSCWLVTSCTFGVLKVFSCADLAETYISKDTPITEMANIDDAHDLGVVSCDFSSVQEVLCKLKKIKNKK